MYRTIRLYGSKIINIVRLSSFLRIRTLCVLFIQLIRDFFYFHFKECCFFENQKIDSIRRWMDEHYCDMVLQHFHRYKKSQITIRYGSFGIRERLQCLKL